MLPLRNDPELLISMSYGLEGLAIHVMKPSDPTRQWAIRTMHNKLSFSFMPLPIKPIFSSNHGREIGWRVKDANSRTACLPRRLTPEPMHLHIAGDQTPSHRAKATHMPTFFNALF